jgi:hypothetical protein
MMLLFRRVQMEVASRTLRPPRRARLVGTSYQGLAWCARTTTLRLTSAPTPRPNTLENLHAVT